MNLTLEDVSPVQLEEIRHALGMNYHKKPSRNHFYTDVDDKEWNDLVDRGFATKRRGWDLESAYFKLTYDAVKLVYGKRISKSYYYGLR